GDTPDIAALGAVGHARDLGGLALGEEGITLRLGLVTGHELQETLALLLKTFVERQVDGIAHGVGGRERRVQTARLLGYGRDRVGEDPAVGLGRGKLGIIIA